MKVTACLISLILIAVVAVLLLLNQPKWVNKKSRYSDREMYGSENAEGEMYEMYGSENAEGEMYSEGYAENAEGEGYEMYGSENAEGEMYGSENAMGMSEMYGSETCCM